MSFSSLITEDQIEKMLSQFDDPNRAAASLKDLEQKAPRYLAYLFSQDTQLLKPEEQDLLTFIAAALWQSTSLAEWNDPGLSEDQISELEEKNWQLLQDSKGSFRDRLDVFFNGHPQEDLLALIEDLLNIDEEDAISKEGRDHIFIICKTFLDILMS